jgi:hypothetical protein
MGCLERKECHDLDLDLDLVLVWAVEPYCTTRMIHEETETNSERDVDMIITLLYHRPLQRLPSRSVLAVVLKYSTC